MTPISKAEPRFDLDLKFGQDGERRIEELLHWVASANGQVEVKRKRYLDLEIYVETACDKGRRGVYAPSGISVSTASMWVFVLGDTGMHFAVPTPLLRQVVDDPSSRDREETDGTCPTRGRLVHMAALLYRLKQQQARGASPQTPAAPVPAKPAPVPYPRHEYRGEINPDMVAFGDAIEAEAQLIEREREVKHRARTATFRESA